MNQKLLAVALAAAAASGCSESCGCLVQRPVNSRARREVIHRAATAAHLASRVAPRPQHASQGVFGGQIALAGYDLDPPQAQAGGPLAVTFYWHALKDVARDWEVFVHVDDRGGRAERINGDHWPVQDQFHTDQWKAGDYVADRFVFMVPAYQAHSALELWTGFYIGDERLPISNPKDCPNDGNNRLLAGTVPIP